MPSLPSLLYDINTDASGNGTLVTGILDGWVTDIEVNWAAGANGTLTITREMNDVTETMLSITGATDAVYPVARELVDTSGSGLSQYGYWNLDGQKLTAITSVNGALLSPAVQVKIHGSR